MRRVIAYIKKSSKKAKYILTAIISLFIISRVLVYLIMSGALPGWLFFNIGDTHIHHYVYGIFILIFTNIWFIFRQPLKKEFTIAVFIFGIGLTLLFDEFYMWLTMKTGYYAKLSIDAIIMTCSILLGLVLAPRFKGVNTWIEYIIYVMGFIVIALVLSYFGKDIYDHLLPTFNKLDSNSPK